MPPKGTVERAFELARSGELRTLTQLRSALVRERCEEVDLHLSGRLIRHQLQQVLSAAAAEPIPTMARAELEPCPEPEPLPGPTPLPAA